MELSKDYQPTELLEVIEKFRNDFVDNISCKIESKYKIKLELQVLENRLAGKTTKEIKAILTEERRLSEKNEIKKEIDTYLKHDCNKLNRIYAYNTNEKLIKLIKLKNLCQCIVEKYPSPMLAGFPNESWTPYLLKKYICLYFNVKPNAISKKTITNILYDDIMIKLKKSDRLTTVLDNFETANIYYLYLRFDKFSKNKTKYNRNEYAALFQLHSEFPKFIQSTSRLYTFKKKNGKNHSDIRPISEILNQLLKSIDNSKPTIIFIKSDNLKDKSKKVNKANLKNKYGLKSLKKLSSLPNYHLYIFDDINHLDTNAKYVEAIKNLEKLETKLDSISFKKRDEKKDFSKKIKKQICDFCGDY